MKACNTCGIEKPLDEYPIGKQHRGGRKHRCKACNNAYNRAYNKANADHVRARMREWRKKQPEVNRRYWLKDRYGITGLDYDQMFQAQGGRCAICRNPQTVARGNDRLHVDHCHTTKVVRGLLCRNCNSMLGHARDKTTTLLAAIAYLSRCGKGQTKEKK